MKGILPIEVRRRLELDSLKEHARMAADAFECGDVMNSGEFMAEVCDFMVNDMVDEWGIYVSPKSRDILFHYIVNTVGQFLIRLYHKRCSP